MPNRLHEALKADQTARIITISSEEQITAIADFAAYAEAAELRGDLLPSQDPEYLAEQAAKVAEHLGVLFTLRSTTENGKWDGSPEEKLVAVEAVMPYVDGIDTETLTAGSRDLIAHVRKSGLVTVSSFHDFENMGADVEGIDGITSIALDHQEADYAKVAIMANVRRTAGSIIDYANRARANTIIMGMGPHGKVTREEAIRRGRPAVYISPVLQSEGRPLVVGQLDYLEAEALVQAYRARHQA